MSKGRRCSTIVVGACFLALVACGGSSSGDGDAAVSRETPGPPSLLEADDVRLLEERLIELSSDMVMETGSVEGGGFGYSPVDRVVDGFMAEGQDPVERCQRVADAVADLDGPPATVPVRIIRYIPDGGGEYEVMATGTGGGTCQAGG